MTTQTKTEQLADELENTPFLSTRYEAAAKMRCLEAANAELVKALTKIADWGGDWGPFPENNEDWRAMAVVTARQAVPKLRHDTRAAIAKHGGAA